MIYQAVTEQVTEQVQNTAQKVCSSAITDKGSSMPQLEVSIRRNFETAGPASQKRKINMQVCNISTTRVPDKAVGAAAAAVLGEAKSSSNSAAAGLAACLRAHQLLKGM